MARFNGCPPLLASLLLCLAGPPAAAQPRDCVSSLDGLANLAGEPLPLRWEETSMTAAAPLVLRASLGRGHSFALSRQGAEVLRIGTASWAGTFLPRRD